ncbi:hypothetical protein CCE28_08110 [Anaeromicrobium sediminis]|uniref:YheO-like domain-containing protein n=2 Tax=Anaeromicrobium sediminis TaxID=1478221 RepID=A0A267MKD5_9FIRM|nr:hypothetical protein CCE28_08110 [Anaeromicrobium sediminis]
MKNEKILISFSCFIKDDNNKIVGMLCVNIDEHFGNNNIVANMELNTKDIFY